ncbi:HutD family protein [Salmonella enterica subsp. diarizonae]|nr:HutD family protein [Salmonella enterica subsp. diarizonae]ECF5952039.1 HutD family protein [Salmonella enterica subsp. diarizonae]
MTRWQVLRYANYRPMLWKNGAGMIREILRFPPGDGEFLWRLSMADVALSGRFSFYQGYQRLLSVLSGAGMTLHIDDSLVTTIHSFET